MTDRSSDDRFSMPPNEGGWDEPNADQDDDDTEVASRRSPGLPLPPPGLFARLATPSDAEPVDQPSYASDADYRDDADDDVDDIDDAPRAPSIDLSDWSPETDDEGDYDEADDLAPPMPAAPLSGVADAIDVVEQLAAQYQSEAAPEPESPLAGDDLVFAEAHDAIAEAEAEAEAEAADAEPIVEPVGFALPGEARPHAFPTYALRTGDDTNDDDDWSAPIDTHGQPEPPAFALPMYGGDRSDEAGSDEEILPHFLLDEATPLDVISAQDELREMAQKNRRKSERDVEHKPSLARTLAEIPILLVVAAVIAFMVKTFVAQAYYIPSGSMLPQLKIDDRVVVSKLAYKLHDPRRGDIVVFDDPNTGTADDDEVDRSGVAKVLHKIGEGVGVVQPSTDEFIKRVIALPGESVSGHDGYVYINDHKLIEPYLPQGVRTDDFAPQTVAKGKLWVMGDNRSGSADSRVFGQIDVDSIVGRAVVKVWPFSHIAFL